jgi:hypothetical protein
MTNRTEAKAQSFDACPARFMGSEFVGEAWGLL